MGNAFRSHLLACCVAGVLVSAAASADVTMQEQMSLSGAGMMKMANMSGTTTTVISRDRARTESNLTFESAMMRTFAGGAGNHVEIVRLDQDKIYSLNPKKKTYSETTFEEMRAKMQQAMEQMNKAQASQQQSTSGVDESECEWSEPKSDVKRTGEKVLIAGFQAERITVTASQSCTNKKDGSVCDFGLAMDQWIAPGFEASTASGPSVNPAADVSICVCTPTTRGCTPPRPSASSIDHGSHGVLPRTVLPRASRGRARGRSTRALND